MSINIKTLNVGDGDCHIITLKKNELTRVVLIDGGDKGNEKLVLEVLEQTLKAAGRAAPDLIVCTHYDQDHIFGLMSVVQKYGDQIGKCWMHMPDVPFEKSISLLSSALSQYQDHKMATHVDTMELVPKLAANQTLFENVGYIIKSYTQMQQLRSMLKGKIIEPFADDGNFLEGFPEFKIIGPNKEFYKKYLPSNAAKMMSALATEPQQLAAEIALFESASSGGCERLGKSSKNKVSGVNMVSIIISYIEGDQQYLFTGDAGIESFTSIKGYQELLKNVHFMTIPHHGAQYNFSTALIELTNPKTAFVSAAGKLEDGMVKRPHPFILNCLRSHEIDFHLTQSCTKYLEFTESSAVNYVQSK